MLFMFLFCLSGKTWYPANQSAVEVMLLSSLAP